MNIRQRKRALFLIAAALLVAAVGIVFIAMSSPIEVTPKSSSVANGGVVVNTSTGPTASVTQTIPLADLARVAARPLRLPLEDPEISPTNPVGAGTSLPVQLIGTAEEFGESRAVFQQRDGSTVVGHVGKTLDTPSGQIKVINIELDQVTVEFAGRRHTLQAPKLPNGGPR